MKIIDDKVNITELKTMSQKMFGNLVKAVVDIEKEIMAVDAPMHADQEAELIKNGSRQENLWGINLYPDKSQNDFIEYDSIINLKPNQNNRTRDVDDPKIKEKIIKIVEKFVKK